MILALPVNTARDNVLAWHYDNKGLFSVKSAYKVCRRNTLLKQNSSSGSADSRDDIWKRIWKMDCPNKVKHFIWRAAHNSHPSGLIWNIGVWTLAIDVSFAMRRVRTVDTCFTNAAGREVYGLRWACQSTENVLRRLIQQEKQCTTYWVCKNSLN